VIVLDIDLLSRSDAYTVIRTHPMALERQFDWQEAGGRVSVKAPVLGWRALEGSDGRRRDPAREQMVEPWPYPLRGVLVEVLVTEGETTGADSPREFFLAIDVAGVRIYELRDDSEIIVHRHPMRTG
jgi:hypothetical protein